MPHAVAYLLASEPACLPALPTQLCEGASVEERTRWQLQAAKEYHYLNQSTCFDLAGVNNADEYKVRGAVRAGGQHRLRTRGGGTVLGSGHGGGSEFRMRVGGGSGFRMRVGGGRGLAGGGLHWGLEGVCAALRTGGGGGSAGER